MFFNYVVVTTKNIPDGPPHSTVPHILEPILKSNSSLSNKWFTNILLVQNGIDIEKDIIETFSKDQFQYTVLSGIQFIGSTKIGSGNIKQIGKDHITVGPFLQSDPDAIKASHAFIQLYDNKGINFVEFDQRVRYNRWKKLLYNAAINTATALVQLDVPRCLEFSKGNDSSTEFQIFIPAMREIVKIAATEGIVLDEQFIEFFTNITRNKMFRPSMCVDVDKGQLMELEVILGNPIRIAKKNGVETPVLSMLYNLLILVQGKLLERNNLIQFDETTCRLAE